MSPNHFSTSVFQDKVYIRRCCPAAYVAFSSMVCNTYRSGHTYNMTYKRVILVLLTHYQSLMVASQVAILARSFSDSLTELQVDFAFNDLVDSALHTDTPTISVDSRCLHGRPNSGSVVFKSLLLQQPSQRFRHPLASFLVSKKCNLLNLGGLRG